MARPIDQSKRDPVTNKYLSQIKWFKDHQRKGRSYYLPEEAHSLALRKMKKHGLKTISETVKRGLEVL